MPLTISVVTPSLNQGDFIRATINSVLDQNYPALDYLIVDGGSSDGTIGVLREFSNRLRWISEPDRGQADAINKGLRMARGDVMAYLNADDLYLPGALERVSEYLTLHPQADWIYGNCRVIDETGLPIGQLVAPPFNLQRMVHRADYVPQPTVFWRRSAADRIGEFDVTLRFAMDYDYFIRLGQYTPGHRLAVEMACFRLHPSSKTIFSANEEAFWRETLMVSERYGMKPWTVWFWLRRARHRGLRVLPKALRSVFIRRLRRTQDEYAATHADLR